jgi:hypothetical protein
MKRAAGAKKQPKFSSKTTAVNVKREYPPPRHRVHLKTAEDIRRLLSGTINDLRQQKICPVVAGKVIYGCQVLLNVFEQNHLAAQIRELEERANSGDYY